MPEQHMGVRICVQLREDEKLSIWPDSMFAFKGLRVWEAPDDAALRSASIHQAPQVFGPLLLIAVRYPVPLDWAAMDRDHPLLLEFTGTPGRLIFDFAGSFWDGSSPYQQPVGGGVVHFRWEEGAPEGAWCFPLRPSWWLDDAEPAVSRGRRRPDLGDFDSALPV